MFFRERVHCPDHALKNKAAGSTAGRLADVVPTQTKGRFPSPRRLDIPANSLPTSLSCEKIFSNWCEAHTLLHSNIGWLLVSSVWSAAGCAFRIRLRYFRNPQQPRQCHFEPDVIVRHIDMT